MGGLEKVNIFVARFRLVHMGSWVQSTNYKVGGLQEVWEVSGANFGLVCKFCVLVKILGQGIFWGYGENFGSGRKF